MSLYRCTECGKIFDEDELIEHHTTYEAYYGVYNEFDSHNSMTYYTCPCCGEESCFEKVDEEELEKEEILNALIERCVEEIPNFKEKEKSFDFDFYVYEDLNENEIDEDEAFNLIKILCKQGLKEYYKAKYPENTKVEIIRLCNPEPNYPKGSRGFVAKVDDMCQIHVNWENGGSIALLPEEGDYFAIVK